MKDVTSGKFTFVQINSESLKREMYRLRYRVYVEECRFERPEAHPNGLEIDEYDAHSIHLGALDEAGILVGTCRIVLPSEKGLPIQHAAPDCFPPDNPFPPRSVEVSRLAILPPYRRRIQDGLYGAETSLQPSLKSPSLAVIERRKNPVIILGLYHLIYQVSKRLGITHLYMIAEKKLWCVLERYNLFFQPIGSPIDYHGIRIPYLATLEGIEQHLARKNPAFLVSLIKGVAELHLQEHSSMAAKQYGKQSKAFVATA